MAVSCRGRIFVLARVGSESFQFGSQHFRQDGAQFTLGDKETESEMGKHVKPCACMHLGAFF